jgi:hypothetical protein
VSAVFGCRTCSQRNQKHGVPFFHGCVTIGSATNSCKAISSRASGNWFFEKYHTCAFHSSTEPFQTEANCSASPRSAKNVRSSYNAAPQQATNPSPTDRPHGSHGQKFSCTPCRLDCDHDHRLNLAKLADQGFPDVPVIHLPLICGACRSRRCWVIVSGRSYPVVTGAEVWMTLRRRSIRVRRCPSI